MPTLGEAVKTATRWKLTPSRGLTRGVRFEPRYPPVRPFVEPLAEHSERHGREYEDRGVQDEDQRVPCRPYSSADVGADHSCTRMTEEPQGAGLHRPVRCYASDRD